MANIYSDLPFDIDKIMDQMPHKLRSATNVRAILDAWIKQLNKIEAVISLMKDKVEIDDLSDDMLDLAASNIGISRKIDETDDELIFRIKLKIHSIRSSGNVSAIDTIIYDILNISDENATLRELGNANVEVLISRDSVSTENIDKINTVMDTAKPVGIGFTITSVQIIEYLEEIEHIKQVISGGMVNYYASDLVIATDNRFARTKDSNSKLDFNMISDRTSLGYYYPQAVNPPIYHEYTQSDILDLTFTYDGYTQSDILDLTFTLQS